MNDTLTSQRTAPRAILHAPTPLAATRIHLAIDDLLATITLEQHYQNRESEAIEVSYTMALPLDAALLDVEVEIAGQKLRGLVQPKQQAEMRYEQALAEGHSAFSIRLVEGGLLNIALGNLKPGETLALRIVMAQWLSWNGDRVRLVLPTTIAPRYGQCGLAPADQPQIDLLVENAFKLSATVRGLLARAQLASVTHALAMRATPDGMDFSIERGLMDRDIVIDLRDTSTALRVAGLIGADLNGGAAAMIAFCAPVDPNALRPVVAQLVVDCSGSMGGVSIEQTRVAVRAIVGQLKPTDRINVLRFGSSHQTLLRRPQPATIPVQRTLLQAAETLQADLGGTELLPALNAALDDLYRVPAEIAGERVLFVISDGEVWNLDSSAFLQRCAIHNVRVFAVAVGSAAVEATFAPLTRGTGGALERVLPGDAMAERIARHFERVRSGILQLYVRWPRATHWTQCPVQILPGDGVLLSAGLSACTCKSAGGSPCACTQEMVAQVHCLQPDGEVSQVDVPLIWQTTPTGQASSTLARMLARQRISDMTDSALATQLAVDHQLITEYSAITLVLERAAGEQLDQLPALRSVPQMLAAGWAGSSDVIAETSLDIPQSIAMPTHMPAPAPLMAPQIVSSMPLPTGGSARSKPSAAKGKLRQAVDHFVGLLAADERCESERSGFGAQSADDLRRRELIALLLRQLADRPELIVALKQARLSLSLLALELPPDLFNWLDGLAEAQGLDLESGAFWKALVEELCVRPDGEILRRRLV